jgi:hypothetical protein
VTFSNVYVRYLSTLAGDDRGEEHECEKKDRGHVSRFRNAVTLAATW